MLIGKDLSVTCASFTEIGGRSINEDSIFMTEIDNKFCFVAADGLGGHGHGEQASKILIDVFKQEFENYSGCDFLARAFEKSQEKVLEFQKTKNQARTTAVVLVISGSKCYWGHIGDSRLYRFRKQRIITRTLDHSVSQILAITGDIKESEIATHSSRSRLLRAVGDNWTDKPYELSKKTNIKKDDYFLLCTDGLWEILPEKALIPRKDISVYDWIKFILDETKILIQTIGDADNFSAIGIKIEGR